MAFNSRQPRGPDGRWIKSIGSVSITNIPAPPSRRRGAGWSGLKQNTIPYARINKRGQTAGINAGTRVSKHHRIAVGAYARVESTGKRTNVDKFVDKSFTKVFPKGKKRSIIPTYIRKTTRFVGKNTQVRGLYKGKGNRGVEARIGTSRRAGPTLIIRRGPHKTPKWLSAKGINRYNNRMETIAGHRAKKKRSRPQRRKAARKKNK